MILLYCCFQAHSVFLFQTWKVFNSGPYKVWMMAEGRSSSILTDICISGDNCHVFWPFSHPVLNIFINDWRISQSKDTEIVFSKHWLLLFSQTEMHGPDRPHPGQLCHTWPPNFLFSPLIFFIWRLPASFASFLCLLLLFLCPNPLSSWLTNNGSHQLHVLCPHCHC